MIIVTKEMERFFIKRTLLHIRYVQDWAEKIEDIDPAFIGLTNRTVKHDSSKFDNPERYYYVFLTWDHKCKSENVNFEIPEQIRSGIRTTITHHVKSNRHHPGYFDEINDVMGPLDIAEMMADWFAMSQEKLEKLDCLSCSNCSECRIRDSVRIWLQQQSGSRYKFTDEQIAIIIKILDVIV